VNGSFAAESKGTPSFCLQSPTCLLQGAAFAERDLHNETARLAS
jgi:hypothetical protein